MFQHSAKVAVDISAVRKVYGQGANPYVALDGVSLDIRENEFFTLLGPSGCGKTTLLRLIAGFDFPSDGDIRLYGESIVNQPPFRRPVNTVFQSYALFPHMSVRENVAFGLEMLGWQKSAIEARVTEVLRLVRMEQFGGRRTDQVSGGQAQRVALARALAPKPKLLLLDEPLSALDYKLRKEMQIELKRLQNETGITFIFVTHDQEEALAMSDRIAVMSAGRVLQVGPPKDIYNRPADRFVASFIGDSNFLEGKLLSAQGNFALVRVLDRIELSVVLPIDFEPHETVTMVVRPEHMRVVPIDGTESLIATVRDVSFIGTDTVLRVEAEGGQAFSVRTQNNSGYQEDVLDGGHVGIAFPQSGMQILRNPADV